MTRTDPSSIPRLVEQMLAGDRAALAQLISCLERDVGAEQIRRLIAPHLERAFVVGLTGPPGAGKSTLVDQLAHLLSAEGHTVGVVAVDPTSPISGGALLGDRIRMRSCATDPAVFVRSLANRCAAGGLAPAAPEVIHLLDAAGKDWILVETVGVGQAETAVAACVDCTVALLVPDAGDAMQLLKAGLLEVADLFVVNKGDRPGAVPLAEGLRAELALRGRAAAPESERVLVTEALNDKGIEMLLQTLARYRQQLACSGELQRRREQRRVAALREIVLERIRERLDQELEQPELEQLLAAVRAARQEIHAAADAILRRLLPRDLKEP